MNLLVETSSEKLVHIFTTPLNTHLDVYRWYVAASSIILTVPEIYSLIVGGGCNVFLLLVFYIVCCNNRSKISLVDSASLLTDVNIVWDILLELNCLAFAVIDLEAFLVPLHNKQVFYFFYIKHGLDFSVVRHIILNI